MRDQPTLGIGDTTLRNMRLRRIVFAGLVLSTMAGLACFLWIVLDRSGWNWPKIGFFLAYLPTMPWTAICFWNAVIGFALMHGTRDPLRIVNPLAADVPDDPITSRTAILLAIRHEAIEPVEARLLVLSAELARTGFAGQFDLFVLSDSARADSIAAEAAMIERLKRDGIALTYRRRDRNDGFKAGNIRDFCERWGDGYEFMLPLDADSLMSGDAILRLVRVMQRYPKLGILQSLVVGLPAESFFTRAFQFGMRQGMRCYTLGGAWWQGDCGPYWGHNALIRVAPFTSECDLPILPGPPPLGGHILSHDQVEAVLMRRAGYEVRVLPVEGGSWEENPPGLPDFIKRDLRWCQGNMQYWRLLSMPGLKSMSRIQLSLAIQMYLGAPAWVAMILFGAAETLVPSSGGSYPLDLGLGFFALTLAMTFTPKLTGVLDILVTPSERRAYGGAFRVIAGALTEFVFSTLLGPAVNVAESIFMLGLLRGHRIIWEAQKRSGSAVSWAEAARGLWPQTLFGIGLLALFAIAAPGVLPWVSPLLASLLLAIPFTVLTAAPGTGRIAQALHLCAIPDELRPAPPVEALALAISDQPSA